MNTRNWPEPWPDIDQSLTDMATAADQANPDEATDGTIDDLARRLDMIDRTQAVLREARDGIVLALAENMEEDTVLTGVGMIRRKERRPSKQWRDDEAVDRFHDDLVRAVADEQALDTATGEMDPMKRNVAAATARALLGNLSRSWNLRIDGQRRFGIYERDYRSAQGAPVYSITIEGTDEP